MDHAFECVGGDYAAAAINQIIDLIEPEGTVSLMGVSENPVDINTRMVLERGLRLFGSSRSGAEDFERTVALYVAHPDIPHYLENLVGDVVKIRSIADIHKAFELDIKRGFGKTVCGLGKVTREVRYAEDIRHCPGVQTPRNIYPLRSTAFWRKRSGRSRLLLSTTVPRTQRRNLLTRIPRRTAVRQRFAHCFNRTRACPPPGIAD